MKRSQGKPGVVYNESATGLYATTVDGVGYVWYDTLEEAIMETGYLEYALITEVEDDD